MNTLEFEQVDYRIRVEPARLKVGLATNTDNPGKILSRIPQTPGFVNYATLARRPRSSTTACCPRSTVRPGKSKAPGWWS